MKLFFEKSDFLILLHYFHVLQAQCAIFVIFSHYCTRIKSLNVQHDVMKYGLLHEHIRSVAMFHISTTNTTEIQNKKVKENKIFTGSRFESTGYFNY